MPKEKFVAFLFRLSIASVFAYAAVATTINPGTWISFFPPFLFQLVPANILLPIFSLYEIILSLWILSGKKLFFSSLLASLTLLGIIASNFSLLDIVFRDFAIFFIAIALTIQNYKKK